MPPVRYARLAAAIALTLVLPDPVAVAQPPDRQTTFAERVEVRVVNLEAVVLDAAGNRLRGLGPADFRLRVDGRDVPIQFFAEVGDGLAGAPPAPAAAGGAGPAPPSGVEPGRPVGTSYLVFIDDFLTFRQSDRDLVLGELAGDLDRLGSEDRMAIVAFDGRRLEVLSDWTGSRARLERALAAARERPLHGLETQSLVRVAVRGTGPANPSVPSFDPGPGDPMGGVEASGLTDEAGVPLDLCARIGRFERQLHKAVLGVTATLRSFPRPPGRPVMLLLSGGWPNSVRDYLGGDVAPQAAGRCLQEGPKLFRPIYQIANLLGYTLYPVDLPGPAIGAESAANPGLAGDAMGIQADFEVHNTLLRLAAETGGEASIDAGRLTAFDRAVDDTRSYYWLGFSPDRQGDDREHSIELQVLRPPGAKVRTRQGFQDLSRSAEVSFLVESALLFEKLPGHSLWKCGWGLPARARTHGCRSRW